MSAPYTDFPGADDARCDGWRGVKEEPEMKIPVKLDSLELSRDPEPKAVRLAVKGLWEDESGPGADILLFDCMAPYEAQAEVSMILRWVARARDFGAQKQVVPASFGCVGTGWGRGRR